MTSYLQQKCQNFIKKLYTFYVCCSDHLYEFLTVFIEQIVTYRSTAIFRRSTNDMVSKILQCETRKANLTTCKFRLQIIRRSTCQAQVGTPHPHIVSFPPWIQELSEARGMKNFERQGTRFLGGSSFSGSGKGETRNQVREILSSFRFFRFFQCSNQIISPWCNAIY